MRNAIRTNRALELVIRGVVVLFLFAGMGSGVARSGMLLFSDTAGNTIYHLSLMGQQLGVFASTGLDFPTGLALDRSANLYVANTFSNTIRKFSPTGDDLGNFVSMGVNEPIDLTFDSAGNLFVSNIGDNSIREFSSTGQDLGVVASLLGIGCPTALAFDSFDNLLVTDPCASVVRKFSSMGESLGIFASTGLSNPSGIALNASGRVFVSNTDQGIGAPFQNTIHEFSPTGQDLGTFATGLNFPGGLAFDNFGNLYVANEVGSNIQKFSPTGRRPWTGVVEVTGTNGPPHSACA